ncbi:MULTISPECIES: pyroglutamyl-peptidase I [Clostridium]|uniref:pyroglutamyl-peptidase I n=1 Tax=Clostridium TaxID=1485 RepID=UPI00069FB635|nr:MULTISPECIES: pyroglutamyl-peptidase I [Clostridium]KOF56410.1 pyrrolidone-carboxylate peptidase [Clostridium sp. DMHC 10]MCD2345842.1 pyroglutamyl-peptidase I [Clostridium guangxiense]
MKKVLITGFDPFGGEKINPALEAIKELKNNEFHGIELKIKEIPTVFYKSIKVLEEAVEEFKPDVVICVGQAGGRNEITVERVAINVIDARISDNENNKPVDMPIVENGSAAYFATIPVKDIVSNIKEAGIPASVSNTAGTFVCNQLFYGLMHIISTKYTNITGGFIHIPYLPEQAVNYKNQPSMSLLNMVKALEIAVNTAAK